MTIEVSRRQLMTSAGGMVLASFALPPSLRKVLDSAPASLLGADRPQKPISEIKHVVVLMQANRSLDHYFGTMPGVRGFGDKKVSKNVFYQPDTSNPDKYLLPFHADSHTRVLSLTSAGDAARPARPLAEQALPRGPGPRSAGIFPDVWKLAPIR